MAAANDPGISKIDAVRKALEELGKKAKPGAIREFVKEKFGLEMSLSHVSNCKTHLRKKKRKKKTAEPAPATAAAAPAKVASARASGSGVSLSDIAAVKDLVGRVGEENLKGLIDVLGG